MGSTTAAWLSIGTGVAYQALLLALIFFRPDLNPAWHSVSEWAIGPHGRIMSGTFLVCSISYFSSFALLRTQLRSRMGRIGLPILLICAAGVAGAGLFTTDPMPFRPPLSIQGTLHVVSGTSQLVLFPLAALLLNLSLARTPAWSMARKTFAVDSLGAVVRLHLPSLFTPACLLSHWARAPHAIDHKEHCDDRKDVTNQTRGSPVVTSIPATDSSGIFQPPSE